ATVLADVIKAHTAVNPLIKWPNDVLLNKKKAAGILTEMQAEQDQIQYIVIGIGFNVNHTKEDLPEDIEQTATSLHIETGKEWALTTFIQHFLEAFELEYEHFIQFGFDEVKTKWESYGFKIGERIKIANRQKERDAVFIGIADDGALLIKDETNKVSKIYS